MCCALTRCLGQRVVNTGGEILTSCTREFEWGTRKHAQASSRFSKSRYPTAYPQLASYFPVNKKILDISSLPSQSNYDITLQRDRSIENWVYALFCVLHLPNQHIQGRKPRLPTDPSFFFISFSDFQVEQIRQGYLPQVKNNEEWLNSLVCIKQLCNLSRPHNPFKMVLDRY